MVDNLTAVAEADVLAVSVKPQDAAALLDEIGPKVPADKLVDLALRRPADRVLRPAAARGHAGGPGDDQHPGAGRRGDDGDLGRRARHRRRTWPLAEEMFKPLGRTIRVPESQQDAVTALSGSGPAYFYLLVEAMTDAGILLGLPRQVAHDLIVQTAIGSAVMLRDSGEHPVKLREAVTSPAGTTISAIRELENHGVRAALLAALEAARDRAREIADQTQ